MPKLLRIPIQSSVFLDFWERVLAMLNEIKNEINVEDRIRKTNFAFQLI
jgi:hypothetical protein